MNKTLLRLLLMVVGLTTFSEAWADLTTGYYTLKNVGYDGYYMYEDFSSNCVRASSSYTAGQYEKVWKITVSGSNVTMQNVYTGHYIQTQSSTSAIFNTGSTETSLVLTTNTDGSYMFGAYLHCDASKNVVKWGASDNNHSYWTAEAVELTDDDVTTIQAEYSKVDDLKNNASTYNEKLLTFFTDLSCSALTTAYASAEDATIKADMETAGLPSGLQDVAINVKNQWSDEKRGDETDGSTVAKFRVRDYKCYSEASHWCNTLNATQMNDMSNPTGIYANTKDVLYVFVGGDIPTNCSLRIAGATGNSRLTYDSGTALSKGLNVIQASADNQQFYIMYSTSDYTTDMSTYDKLKIHIEGGGVLGFVDAESAMNSATQTETDKATAVNALYKEVLDHANAEMTAKSISTTSMNLMVLGQRGMFMFPVDTYNQIWKTTSYNSKYTTNYYIYNSINWFDHVLAWEWGLMGFTKRIADGNHDEHEYVTGGTSEYGTVCNNKALTLQGESGSNPYATWQYTSMPGVGGVESSYNAEREDFDNWCVGHESGHDNQGAINLPSSTESSNNLFSNVVCYMTGYRMSRGEPVSTSNNYFVNGTQFSLRDIGTTHRMYWQMYLYYHEAQNKTDFYPTLFGKLRANGLNLNSGTCFTEFYKACCDAAQEDLTDYFTVWGFLQPFENTTFGDYTSRTLTLTQAEIDAAIAYVKGKYTKVNDDILFIEDRIESSERWDIWAEDGETRVSQGYNVGQCGTTGSVTSMTPTAKTSTTGDYIYTINNGVLTLTGTAGGAGVIVRDLNGNIVAYGNGTSITLPSSITNASQITVTSVSTDGTKTAEVKDVATAGTEEQQKEALQTLVNTAKAMLALKDDTNKNAGYYKATYLTDLETLYTEAVSAIAAGMTAKYGSLITLLNQEMGNVQNNDDARICLAAGNTYTIRNKAYTTRYASISSDKLVTTEPSEISTAEEWTIEDAGSGKYYIKNVSSGKYVSYSATSTQAQANATSTDGTATSSSTDVAYTYTITDCGDGTFTLQATEAGGYQYWHSASNASYNIVGWAADAPASYWYMTCVDESEEGAAITALTSTINKASSLLNMVCSSWTTYESVPLQASSYTDPYYISTNAQEVKEGPIANLVDGNTSTFFHSTWSTSDVSEDHYIKIDMGSGNEIDQFILSFYNRLHSTAAYSGYNSPTNIVISGSNDDSEYTTITTLTTSDGLPTTTGSQSSFTSGTLGTSGTKYRYLKFTVTATNTGSKVNGHVYFSLGELSLPYSSPKAVYTFNSGYSETDITSLEALITEVYSAQKILASGTTDERTAENTTLTTKYNTLLDKVETADKASYRAQINALITSTNNLISSVVDGEYTYDTGEVPVFTLQTTDASASYYLTANHQEAVEGTSGQGAIANMIDDNASTFFHSTWSASTTDQHYWQVDMGSGNEISDFTFILTPHSGHTGNFPNDITIQGSNDNSTYNNVVTLNSSSTPAMASSTSDVATYASATISSETKYRYWRFVVNGTVSGNGNNTKSTYPFFVLGEFSMTAVSQGAKFNGTKKTLYSSISDNILVNAADAKTRAAEKVADEDATVSELKLTLADITGAYNVLNNAKTAIDNDASTAERAQLKTDIETLLASAATLKTAVMGESALKEQYAKLNDLYSALSTNITSATAIVGDGYAKATVESLTDAKTSLQTAYDNLNNAKTAVDAVFAEANTNGEVTDLTLSDSSVPYLSASTLPLVPGHFAITTVSKYSTTAYNWYNGGGSLSTTLTSAYLLDLESNGTAGQFYLKSYDGQYFSCGNATPASGNAVTKSKETTGRQSFTLSQGSSDDAAGNNFSGYSSQWVRFTDVANTAVWLNSQSNGTGIYNAGTGGWTAFVPFGPYYIATINYVDADGNAVGTATQKIVKANTTVTATAPTGYQIKEGQPTSLAVTYADASADIVVELQTYSVSGKITSDGTTAVEGVTVQMGDYTATTDASGAYTFDDVTPGTYTLKAVKDSKYAPTTLSVTVADADLTGKDLTYSYVIGFDPTTQYSVRTAGGRYTTQVGFTDNLKSTGYTANTSTNYVDLTGDTHFSFNNSGVSLTPTFSAMMNAMRFFTFIDYNNDGDFSDTGELVSKLSDALSGGSSTVQTYTTPAFTLGTTTGSYHIRFICDWENETGAGASSIPANGGCIVDAMLDITTMTYAEYSSAISTAVTAANTALTAVSATKYSALSTEKSAVNTALAALQVEEANYTEEYANNLTTNLATLNTAVEALNTAKAARDTEEDVPFTASTLDSPVYYYIHNKATTGRYVLARSDDYLGHGTDKTANGAGVFIFIDANNDGSNGYKRYYIYNVSAESYLKYTQNTAGKKTVQQVADNTDEACQWYILSDNKTDNTAIDIMPGNVDLTADSYQSWNVNGGFSYTDYMGLYSNTDDYSAWVPEAVTLTSDELATLKANFAHYYAKTYTENKGSIGYLTTAKGDAIDALTTLSDVKTAFAALVETDVVKPTTGYYRIKNKDTDWYAFSNMSFSTSRTLLSGSHSESTDAIWYVTMDDAKLVSAVNVNGNQLTNVTTAVSNVSLQGDPAKNWIPGTLYIGGLHASNQTHLTLNNTTYDAETNPGITTGWSYLSSKGSRWIFYPVDESVVDAYYKSAITTVPEIYTIYCKGSSRYACYDSGSVKSADDDTNILTVNSTITTNTLFKVEQSGDYYTIRLASDPTRYVYAVSTEDADGNVGTKKIADGETVGDECLWTISTQSDGKNIIPKSGSYSWNVRGSYNGKTHIGMWNNNTANNDIWYVTNVVDGMTIADKYVGTTVSTYTEASVKALRRAYNAFCVNQSGDNVVAMQTAKTNLVLNMPEEGKLYKFNFQFLDKDEQQLYYDATNDRVACNALSEISSNGYKENCLWECHASETSSGQFYFKNASGKYLVWCDSGNSTKSVSVKGYTDSYTAAENDWTIEKADATSNGGTVSGLTDDVLLGSYQMKATGADNNTYYLNARWEGETTNSAFISSTASYKFYDANTSGGNKPRSYVFRMEELSFGDANTDGSVSVSDLSMVQTYILEATEATNFYKTTADANKDGSVSVSDMSTIVSMILGNNSSNARSAVSANEINAASCETLNIKAGEDALLYVNVDNTSDICAFQFDAMLPQGFTCENVTADFERVANGASLSYAGQKDGAMRVLCYSMDNSIISGNYGSVAVLKVHADSNVKKGTYEGQLQNVELTSGSRALKVANAPIIINVDSATGINGMDADGNANERVYDMNGRLQNKSNIKSGAYISNGKKYIAR